MGRAIRSWVVPISWLVGPSLALALLGLVRHWQADRERDASRRSSFIQYRSEFALLMTAVIVEDYASKRNHGLIPGFDSANPPSWWQLYAHLGPAEAQVKLKYEEAFRNASVGARCRIVVAPSLVGKSLSKLREGDQPFIWIERNPPVGVNTITTRLNFRIAG